MKKKLKKGQKQKITTKAKLGKPREISPFLDFKAAWWSRGGQPWASDFPVIPGREEFPRRGQEGFPHGMPRLMALRFAES